MPGFERKDIRDTEAVSVLYTSRAGPRVEEPYTNKIVVPPREIVGALAALHKTRSHLVAGRQLFPLPEGFAYIPQLVEGIKTDAIVVVSQSREKASECAEELGLPRLID